MSVLKRVVAVAAASALVVATVGAGSPASASKIKIKAKVRGTTTIAKTGDTLRIPKGATLKANLVLPGGKIRRGRLKVPTITAHIKASIPGLEFLPPIPTKAKVRMVQTRRIRGRIIQRGKNRGHMKAVAHTRLAVPKVTLDLPIPLLNNINIVQDTCTTEPFKIKMMSKNRLRLNRKIKVNTTFTIPRFDGCSIVNIPPFDLRNSLLTKLLSGPGNELHLKIGPLRSAS